MDDSLSFESLFEGASRVAQKAIEDHGRGEYDEFALHAGVAVERLAKAVLVTLNPLYLVEMRNGNADMLLYFGGHLELETSKVRTVGAKEAVQRLRRIGVLPPDSQLDLLIELRNGTAHTTVGDQGKTLLPTLSETVLTLLTAVGMTSSVFWGRWARTVIVAVDRQLDEIHRDVEIRVDQARHLFEDRFEGLPEGTKEKIFTETEASEAVAPGLPTVVCPACGGKASVTLSPIAQPDTGLDVVADAFRCGMCGLALHNPLEIKAAQVQTEAALLFVRTWIKQMSGPVHVQL
ncbi:hypothetical protein OHA09_36160 [Streptomyces longwoodensis]|uniref:hypothetical protein n=1 Tax=Streptomyces longwoodensis TaxID=68231 RepID=UPI002E815B47|nr:hypothetical protein [Streptomyces longwoodensis]WUC55732.1 hypothetical protein OHA09_00815 [Streptomyces longwoodensis]WUC62149.1 hypothetical protein OHA09_36160 [Streptomyces longwoodensis]